MSRENYKSTDTGSLSEYPLEQALIFVKAVINGRIAEKQKSIRLGWTRNPDAKDCEISSETKAQQVLFKLSEFYHYSGDIERYVLGHVSDTLEESLEKVTRNADTIDEEVDAREINKRKEKLNPFFQKLIRFNTKTGYAPDYTPLEKEYWSGFKSYFTGVEEPQLRFIHQKSPGWKNLSFGVFELLYFAFIMNSLTHGVPISIELFKSFLEHMELESASQGLESMIKILERGQIVEELASAWLASRLLPRFGRLDINRLVLDLARNMTELDIRTAESVSASLAKILLLFLLFRFLHLPVAE